MVGVVLDDFALAAELVRSAGLLAAGMRRAGVATETKTSVSDVVTAADRSAEALIVGRLRTERPGDGLVGEEGTDEPAERTWFIDPVDGTYNFTRELPMWCSAIALVDSDGPVLGAIYHPATDELWLGGRAHPTTCNGELVTPDPRPLSQIAVASYLHPTTLPDDRVRVPLLRAISAAATVRMIGSGSIELAAVAAGRLGCFVQHDSLPWDWWPGAALVTAAGGASEVFELDGVRWHVAGGVDAVAEASALLRGE
jgi:fructose-1,6-bisphosphatase/inositol monophosphatase family enzyme